MEHRNYDPAVMQGAKYNNVAHGIFVGPSSNQFNTSNSTTENVIQAALDAGAGKDIYFEPNTTFELGGSSLVNNGVLNVSANTTLHLNSSVLKLKDNVNAILIQNKDQNNGDDNIKIIGGTVDGNGLNQSDNNFSAIRFVFSKDIYISGTIIKNGRQHNLFLSDGCDRARIVGVRLYDSVTLSNLSTFNVRDSIFTGIVSSGATQTGIKLDGGLNNTISGCSFFNNDTHQIFLTGGTNNVVSGCSARGGQNGVRLTSQDFSNISGLSIRDCSQHGIVLNQNCNHNVFTGNLIRNVSSEYSPPEFTTRYNGIHITNASSGGAACTDNLFSSNRILDENSNMGYGVFSELLSDTNYVINNYISGHTTGEISLANANNVIKTV